MRRREFTGARERSSFADCGAGAAAVLEVNPWAAVHGVAPKRLPMTVFSNSQEVSRA
jgi:hypothetical protein